jgi:two-component system sensor histidine kinase MprB
MTLRSRLALLSAAATAVVVIAASVAAYVTTSTDLRRAFDERLIARASGPGPRGGFDPDRLGGVARPDPGGIRTSDLSVRLVSATGQVSAPLGADRAPAVTPDDLAIAAGTRASMLRDVEVSGIHLRVYTVSPRAGFALMLAEPLAAVDDALGHLQLVLLLIGGLGIAAAAGLGLVVARAGLGPLDRLGAAAERVAATEDLSERLPAEGASELARLGTTINAMLEALEASRAQQRHLIEDASHELRTPLASMRTNVELLARSEAAGTAIPLEDRKALLHDLTEQAEELSVLVGELVDLARDPSLPDATGEVSLAAVVQRAAARARLHDGPTLTLDLTDSVVHGDQRLLERAVVNVIANALAWSPADGTVDVRLADGTIVVRDRGPGFLPADLPRVFDRFYRSDAARGKPGSGLGLAIVRQVAERHGGTATASNAPEGGAIVTITLPSIT